MMENKLAGYAAVSVCVGGGGDMSVHGMAVVSMYVCVCTYSLDPPLWCDCQ